MESEKQASQFSKEEELKIRNIMENIKANIFSTVFLFVLGSLLLLAYYLLKDYFTSLCFAFVSAISIKPLKNSIVEQLVLSIKASKQTNIIKLSILARLIRGAIFIFTNPRESTISILELLIQIWNQVKNFRTELLSLVKIACTYIAIFKIGIQLSLIFFASFLLIDIFVRSIIFSYRRIQEKLFSDQLVKSKKSKKRQEIEEQYNAIISILCVMGFVSAVIFLSIAFGGLCLWDIIDMRNKAGVQLQEQLQLVNKYLENEGIKSYLDENYIKEQVLSQVDKLDTYISGSNFLPAIQIFQSVVNQYFNSTNAEIIEQEATFQFRKRIDQCQINYQKYSNLSYVPQFIQKSANELTAIFCYFQISIESMEINISEILNNLKNVGGNLYSNLQRSIIWVVQSVLAFLFSIIDYFLQSIIYLTCLYYLIHSPKFSMSTILYLLPLEHQIKHRLESSLEKNIRGVFAGTLKISFYHMILTWLILDILDLPFAFITSIFAGTIAILPIVPVYCITLPYCLYLYFNSRIIEMLFLFFGYFHISMLSIDAFYKRNIAIHPFITGICVAMGMSVFDLKGIIIGPLIVCSVYILIDILGQMQTQTIQQKTGRKESFEEKSEEVEYSKKPNYNLPELKRVIEIRQNKRSQQSQNEKDEQFKKNV